MNAEQRYKKFELIIGVLGFYVAVIAVGVAYLDYLGSQKEAEATLDASNRQAETYLYVQLKSRFEEIVKEMPSNRLTERYKANPKNIKDWKYFEDYWQQSFDEWYASTQLLEPKHSHLWDEYYASAIKDALAKTYYVDSLCILINNRATTWRHKGGEFLKALQDMYPSKGAAPGCLATLDAYKWQYEQAIRAEPHGNSGAPSST